MVGVFIPNKEAKERGRKFGFVRFGLLNEAHRAVKRMNGRWLFGNRLGVNLTGYAGRTSYWRKITQFTY